MLGPFFYIFYSMFGFQRTGDQFWAAGDQLARGFVIGATAGRTTLAGEGLQHMDGNSQLLSATNYGFVSYDPAYAYEIRHIVADGFKRMYGPESVKAAGRPVNLSGVPGLDDPRDPNVMYYITVYNEPYVQPAEPENLDVNGLLRGIYRVDDHAHFGGPKVQLMASGVGVRWAREARDILAEQWGVDAAVWSVTSWTELRRNGVATDKHNLLHPHDQRTAFLTQQLAGAEGPFIATSDMASETQDLVRPWVPGDYYVLGADGFGISDTRRAARRFYHIDAETVVVQTLSALAKAGQVSPDTVQQAIDRYQLFNTQIDAAPAPEN